MSTRSILISYAGYPYTPGSLMPDNGLANLAGALIGAGHETLILDYGTVEGIRRLYPEHLSRKALPLYRRLLNGGSGGGRASVRDRISMKYLDRRLRTFRERAVSWIAAGILQKIEELRPHFVGFKLWNGDGFSSSIRIAESIKRANPSVKIFAGGPHVDIFRGHIYSATDVFDALVYAEGEEVLPRLCSYCEGKADLRDIPNVIFKRGDRVHENAIEWIEDLDRLPFPVYDEEIYPAMEGDRKIKIIVIDESRGCPYRCAFCIQPIKSGSKLRLKSPRRVVDEMKQIVRSHRITAFRYAGSSTPLKHAGEIASLILGENLHVTYSSFGHIQRSSDEEFATLRESGCRAIFFGIESGSREILLRGFAKRLEPDLIREVMGACRRAGIYTVGSMIFPGPFETEETERESIDLLMEIKPDSAPVQFPGILPETDWRLDPEKYNFRITSPNYEEEVMNYKIKLLYPPAYWSPLPYRVNNMSFRQFTRKTADFARKLESGGIPTNISDDLALMAFHAGYGGREKLFRDRLRLSFAAGDVAFIEELVLRINGSVRGNDGR